MILKQVIRYDNAVAIEATWVDADDVAVRSTAYAGNQMNLFRADVAQYGGDIADYELLIAEIESSYVPEPSEDQQIAINAEALSYLNSTDWYVVRFMETGVNIPQEILSLRQSARKSIVNITK